MRPQDKFIHKEKEFANFPHTCLHTFEFYAGEVASFSHNDRPPITLIDVLNEEGRRGFNTTFGEILQIEFSGQIYVSRGDFLKVTFPILISPMKFTSSLLKELISQPRDIQNPEKALIISTYHPPRKEGQHPTLKATYHSTQYTQFSDVWCREGKY